MKILHVTQQLISGGVTNVILNMLKEFWKLGVENIIITFTKPSSKYLKIINNVTSKFHIVGTANVSPHTSYFHTITNFYKVREIVAKEKPDAIIIQPGWLSLLSKAIPENTPTVIVVHGTYKNEIEFMRYHPLYGIEKLRYMLGIRISHKAEMMQLFTISRKKNVKIIAVSRNTRKELVAERVPESKVFSILNGVDKERFKPINKDYAKTLVEELIGIKLKDKLLLHVNPSPRKGTHILIKAIAILKRIYGKSLKLLIVGRLEPKTYREYMKEMIRSLNLERDVVMLGYVEDEKLPILYNSADLTVVSSYSEGAPLVIPESLACGTPIVATDVGGNSEYLSLCGLNDLLIKISKYDFSNELASRIFFVLQSQGGIKPRDSIPSWSQVAKTYINVLIRMRG